MSPQIIYYLWAALLITIILVAWASTLLTLPGNWLIALSALVFAYFYHNQEGRGLNWWLVGIVIGLAFLGELVELAAGAAGAAKQGGSRRGMILAIVGAAIGSIVGAVAGAPVPVIGSLIGALAGGAVGAFCGAFVGETWTGKTSAESLAVSKAAMVGRVLGTVGKLAIGAVMVVIVATDAIF